MFVNVILYCLYASHIVRRMVGVVCGLCVHVYVHFGMYKTRVGILKLCESCACVYS